MGGGGIGGAMGPGGGGGGGPPIIIIVGGGPIPNYIKSKTLNLQGLMFLPTMTAVGPLYSGHPWNS